MYAKGNAGTGCALTWGINSPFFMAVPPDSGNVRFVSNEIQNTNIEHKADILLYPPTYRRPWNGSRLFLKQGNPAKKAGFLLYSVVTDRRSLRSCELYPALFLVYRHPKAIKSFGGDPGKAGVFFICKQLLTALRPRLSRF
jgi:hypothetical protein